MKKYDNFCNALHNLLEIYDYEEPYSNVILTGLVGLYEICFEQSWKAIKEVMENEGITAAATGSPRAILKEAYRAGIIADETLWLSALTARNHTSHAYNEAVALEIVEQTRTAFLPMFQSLRRTLAEYDAP